MSPGQDKGPTLQRYGTNVQDGYGILTIVKEPKYSVQRILGRSGLGLVWIQLEAIDGGKLTFPKSAEKRDMPLQLNPAEEL